MDFDNRKIKNYSPFPESVWLGCKGNSQLRREVATSREGWSELY